MVRRRNAYILLKTLLLLAGSLQNNVIFPTQRRQRREGTDPWSVGTTSARPPGPIEIPGGLSFAATFWTRLLDTLTHGPAA
jgi:hypothetical protein